MIDSFHIACIQDENGIIFIFDTTSRKITGKFSFAKDGDYEDIVIVNKIFYVLESNGHLFQVENPGEKGQSIRSYQTQLGPKNDCEGLCYDSLTKSLLIACKGHPFLDKDKTGKHKRAIYRFDLAKKEMIKDPFLIIHVNEIEKNENLDTYGRFSYDLASALDPDGNIVFQPSGIAIQPVTGYLFVLAHVGKTLLILDRDGQLLAMMTLSMSLFAQPEGICFTKAGDMFISNEGAGGKATILLFKNKIPR
ncbi:MAG: SdiA-regulated domain-containing protein [Bacteroidetes bacterium]|nr:SdiA-regulated domain-containing protein [Bacteroidota bacterium]